MLIAYYPVIVALIGLLIWALASGGIAKRAGEYMFAIGLLWTVYSLVGHTLKLG